MTRIEERVSGMLVVGDRIVADLETSVDRGAARPTHTIVVTHAGVLPELEVALEGAPIQPIGSTGVYLPAQMRTGMRWSYRVEFEKPGGARSYVDARMEAVAVERLEVPAGTFDVLHLRRELKSGEHQQSDDLYYARGVGLIAATTTSAAGYRSDRRLLAYRSLQPH